jgi:hypothetical protein
MCIFCIKRVQITIKHVVFSVTSDVGTTSQIIEHVFSFFFQKLRVKYVVLDLHK